MNKNNFLFIDKMNRWYDSLKKSPLTPPPLTFQIVWPILYLMILMSLVLYLISSPSWFSTGLALFAIQLSLNFMWTPIFFGLQQPWIALFVLLGLIVSLIFTIVQFHKVNAWSAYLLYPYLVWSIFALYLNFYICIAN